MNTGKTLFAQLMDFLPWTTFTRIVDRYGGDHRVRTLSCAEQYRSMAFAQLTYRESLRDIETCLSVHASKLYHMGFRQPVRRSRWPMRARLAYPCGVERLITQARTLYTKNFGPDQYRLRDSTTIALCLSVFPWAHFRTTKAAVARCSTCGATFRVLSTSRMASCTTFMLLLPEAGAIYGGSWLRDFARMCCTKPGPSSSRVPSRTSMRLFGRIARPASFATRYISLDGFYTGQGVTPNFCGASFRRRWSSHQQLLGPPPSDKSRLAGGTVDQAAFRIKQFYGGVGERGEALDCRLGLRPRPSSRSASNASLYTLLQILSVTLFEKMPIIKHLRETKTDARFANNQPIGFLTGH